jgi:hypothetical protein
MTGSIRDTVCRELMVYTLLPCESHPLQMRFYHKYTMGKSFLKEEEFVAVHAICMYSIIEVCRKIS